jgi:hypothetical protein
MKTNMAQHGAWDTEGCPEMLVESAFDNIQCILLKMLWRTGREQRWLLMPTGAQYLAVILQMNP